MSTGNIIGILFFFLLFVFGMMLTGENTMFFIVGIIGFLGTVYFLTRIVSAILKEMRRRN